ncbi:Nif3-like dinuclear metal center hexameric protein [Alkalimonas collagenimarina]|uniref:Nif3-like dinuclear metal center hexameric protein n=1 Tax=Alkalimonas collagenimarina TaxID=400390 RepID=A0ABT9GWF6_9GAMM|nr:Nif3-like dinuclear metal center hexameric protein [Alkalimonas collagenimarina]MDP4535376.1 Nif3-like dinuclear metal center hexameric protein [Alkalimonas collagenimarina]
MTSVTRQQLTLLLNQQLQPELVQDFCPNGLQVEGKKDIEVLVTGVTASQALVDAAIAVSADAILVHHGYFWKNEPAIITGMKKTRLQRLLTHNINLFAYHLPLDIHPELGNNAQLGRLLGITAWQPLRAVQPQGVVMIGQFSEPKPLETVSRLLQHALGRDVLSHAAGDRLISQVAWCTGGGQGYIDAAAEAGAQLFITGEVSEQTIHSSRELGIHFIAAGHHATERYGVKALGEWLATETGIQVEFIDIPNPA